MKRHFGGTARSLIVGMHEERPPFWKKTISWLSKCLVECGRDFCLETSVHGFKHIAAPRRHWSERFLWVVITAMALWCAVEVSMDQWHRYNENPTVVTLEKDFRSWTFGLPAVTACPKNRVNHTSVPSVIKALWGISPGDPKYDYYVRFVETVANSDIFNLDGFQEFAGDDQLNVDLTRLAVDVLPEVAIKPITSEDARTALFKWTRVITEAGVCYSTNSLGITDVAVMDPDSKVTLNYPIGCKYSSQICYVMFEVAEPIDFYVHSPYDIVDVASQASRVYPSLSRRSELTVMETRCAKGVRELAPRRRGCLFIDEPIDVRKKIYSANTCRLSCRSKRAVELCGCRPFYYVNEEGPVCSVAGMACLSGHTHLLSSTGGKCSCTPQCLDMVYREITVKDTKWEHGPFVTRGSIRYILQAPRTRYNREIVFYLQDLIVSLGGATGLFLGASFISFVEIIYFVIERIFKSLFEDFSTKNNVVNVKKSNPYEADRVIELTRVLDVEKKYPLKLN